MRTHYCGKLNYQDIGKIVKVCGWVEKYINLGKIIFLKIRDCKGSIQIFCDYKNNISFQQAKKLRNEFCIQVIGIIQKKIKTFKKTIEILALKINILNKSKPLPIDLYNNKNQDIRFKYRYLDLRCPKVLKKFIIRNKITSFIRKFLEKRNFLEIETPILTKSTPEGARDYIVPSRIYKNKFYALPQSPQIFKQLLMISGIDRYYQIAKCFRDEDLRSDRQPEFTQVDIEMSFVHSSKIRNIMEQMIKKLFKKIININLKKFKIITYDKALLLYGSDKPDLRNPLLIIELTQFFKKTKYQKYFYLKKNNINRVAAIHLPNKYLKNQKEIYKTIIKKNNKKKIFFIKFKNTNFKKIKIISNIKEIISQNILKEIININKIDNNDVLILIANEKNKANNKLTKLRFKLGEKLNIIKYKKWKALWVINFPLFIKNKENKLCCTNHLFTAPKNFILKDLEKNPEKIISDSYDLIINGYEIGGGSVRINNKNLQKKIFDIVQLKKKIQKKIFGFFTTALQYGTPPHAGIAFGLDRITMLLTHSKSIREVIAFPKTTAAICPVSDAPINLLLK
ncbi:aspartate--tRNA ligase [Buchnera aphidicola (Mollitrichosiphum nigrofasciatum)]|uniref:aspartate--tRNA ligase n=1 Tax=Buchnera aphidicola TaxID=9 RepID=UPI0031B869F9